MSETHNFSIIKRRWTTIRKCGICGDETHDDSSAKAHYVAEHVRQKTAVPSSKSAAPTKGGKDRRLQYEGMLLLACLDNIADMNRANLNR